MSSASAHQQFAGTKIVPKAERKYQRGLQQIDAGDWRGAEKSFRSAIDRSPKDSVFWLNLAQVLRKQGRAEEAVKAAERAVELDPGSAMAHRMLGSCLKESGRTSEAASVLGVSVGSDQERAALLTERGLTLLRDHQAKEAVEPLTESIRLAPTQPQAWVALSDAFKALQMPLIAGECLSAASALQPDNPHLLCASIHLALEACDWRTLSADTQRLLALIHAEADPAPVPFMQLSVPGVSGQDHLSTARKHWQRVAGHIEPLPASDPQARRPGRIRIGYLSCDLHLHATAFLLARVLELHARSDFEVFAYSYGPSDESPMRRRLESAVEHFVDVRMASFRAIADRIRADAIDILVDLKGYTHNARPEVLAFRAAPIQVSYLGFPGTLGADCVDYVITDRIVTPPSLAGEFTEKLAWMPHSYQPNDDTRALGDAPSRQDCGLPEDSFVFCCFNNTYKVTPEVFDVWCRLLRAVPGAVMWMLDANLQAKHNLWREAEARGIDRARFVFAPRVDHASHLLRIQNADLFLDNLPVNAHTTASDALWAGVPVITVLGATFAGRVAASLLHAAGAPELVTATLTDYEAMALRLATRPDELRPIRRRLIEQRETCALFDSDRYTTSLEALYRGMFERYVKGAAPEHMDALGAETPLRLPLPAIPASAAASDAARADDEPNAPTGGPQSSTADMLLPYDACPLCGHQEADELGTWDTTGHPLWRQSLPQSLRWVVCCSCKHVFTDSYFSEAGLRELFKGANASQLAGTQLESQRALWAPVVQHVLQALGAGCGDGKQWLDVGCGSGSLVFTAAEFGFDAIGVDARLEAVERITAFGYQARVGDATALTVDAPADVISMADVLEHLPFPKQALMNVRNSLKPGGLLLISCPNTDSAAWREMDVHQQNPYWRELEHHHNFSRQRLCALLKDCGFDPVAYSVSTRYRAGMEVLARARPIA